MKIFEINCSNFGSTGNIMLHLAKIAREKGHNVFVSYPQSRGNALKHNCGDLVIGNRFSRNLHLKMSMLTGLNGCFSWFATARYSNKMTTMAPDLLHLHNLHNSYINLPMLFKYIKNNNIPVVWTLHDCWSFTGHCPHFAMAKCDKWMTGCNRCPSYSEYPVALLDNSKFMYKLKKKWFTGVQDMTIVTPSQWLADLVKQSFLKEYPVKVIHNGIDRSVFKPTISDFRIRYGIPADKNILLGVAFGWGVKKGLDVFIELSKRLNEKQYQIVLVGTDECIDKQLPDRIISIHRTQNQSELAAIYTATDLFVNPTREEALGLVNIESIACGTPVLTFRTGGCPEVLDETCGSVVDCDDIDALEREIIRICEQKPYSQEACINRAKVFDMNAKFYEYIKLYEEIK